MLDAGTGQSKLNESGPRFRCEILPLLFNYWRKVFKNLFYCLSKQNFNCLVIRIMRIELIYIDLWGRLGPRFEPITNHAENQRMLNFLCYSRVLSNQQLCKSIIEEFAFFGGKTLFVSWWHMLFNNPPSIHNFKDTIYHSVTEEYRISYPATLLSY